MPLKKIRTLLVTFNNAIPAYQISAFRGAVIEKVGHENILFHNHLGEDKYVYAYPLIQYKHVHNQPAIFCVDSGVEEIHHLFEQRNWTIQLLGQKTDLKVDRLDMKTTTLNIWDRSFSYTIYRWQALNESNYRKYQALDSMTEKISMLESILVGNILSFAKGVEWQLEKPIELTISDIQYERLNKMKDIKVAALNLSFRCNVFLPDYLGLGKGVSKGFGVVKQIRSKQEFNS